jgi:hypothetical protein
MAYHVTYHQSYPQQPGFQFWRDRMVSFEHFGMRWCVVVFGPLNDKNAQEIVDIAIVKVLSFAYCVSVTNRCLSTMLESVMDFTNDELVEFKERENLNIFYGVGIAITVVDSDGRMAYAQGGDVVLMLCHEQHRRAQHRPDIQELTWHDTAEKVQPRRNFGTHKTWQGFVSPEYQLEPNDMWFIATEGNFLLMHDQVPDEVVAELNHDPQIYHEFIRDLYNHSGLQYAGILVAAHYTMSGVDSGMGLKDLRIWNEWKELDAQLNEDLPQGILRSGHRPSAATGGASRSTDPTIDYTQAHAKSQPGKRSKARQFNPSWWKAFSNSELIAMMIGAALLVRIILWLMAKWVVG